MPPGGIAESRWWHSDEALGTHLPDDLRDLIIGASESREFQNSFDQVSVLSEALHDLPQNNLKMLWTIEEYVPHI